MSSPQMMQDRDPSPRADGKVNELLLDGVAVFCFTDFKFV